MARRRPPSPPPPPAPLKSEKRSESESEDELPSEDNEECIKIEKSPKSVTREPSESDTEDELPDIGDLLGGGLKIEMKRQHKCTPSVSTLGPSRGPSRDHASNTTLAVQEKKQVSSLSKG